MRAATRLACAPIFGACLLAPATSNSTPASAQPLDLAALAKQSRTLAIPDDALHDAVVTGTPEAATFSPVLDLGNAASAVAWSECSKTACRGSLALLSGPPDALKLARRAALPAPAQVFFVDGFSFDAPALADLDGDSAPEIVLHYSAVEPPRPALGSLVHEYIAVYSPKDLTLIFSHELRRAGGDSEDACQWTLTQAGNQLTAAGRCNARTCLEVPQPAASCKPTRKLLETWRKTARQKTYTKVANPA